MGLRRDEGRCLGDAARADTGTRGARTAPTALLDGRTDVLSTAGGSSRRHRAARRADHGGACPGRRAARRDRRLCRPARALCGCLRARRPVRRAGTDARWRRAPTRGRRQVDCARARRDADRRRGQSSGRCVLRGGRVHDGGGSPDAVRGGRRACHCPSSAECRSGPSEDTQVLAAGGGAEQRSARSVKSRAMAACIAIGGGVRIVRSIHERRRSCSSVWCGSPM